MAMSEVSEALAMGVACGGRATSRTSRQGGERRPRTESWLHWEASPARSAAVESLVMLLVLVRLLVVACEWVPVLVLPGVRHQRHCRQHHRPEVAVLDLVLPIPTLLVLGELAQ